MNSHCSVCKRLKILVCRGARTHQRQDITFWRWKTTGSGREILQPQVNKVNQVSQLVLQLPWESTFIGAFHWEVFFWKGKIHTCRPLASDLNVSRLTNWNVFLSNVRCADSLRTQRLYFWHTNGKSYFQMEMFAIVPLALISNVCANIFTCGIDIKCLRKYLHLWYW